MFEKTSLFFEHSGVMFVSQLEKTQNETMDRLTPIEEKVMLKLWQFERATINDIISLYPDPKPSFNAIQTIVRILKQKNYITHEEEGRKFYFVPILKRDAYRDFLAARLLNNYFNGNSEDLISFYLDKNLEMVTLKKCTQ